MGACGSSRGNSRAVWFTCRGLRSRHASVVDRRTRFRDESRRAVSRKVFTGYTTCRFKYSAAFAEGSSHMQLLAGTLNTAVLLLSSFTMALAIRSVQIKRRKAAVRLLLATLLLGIVFLGIKGYEYAMKFAEHHVPGPAFSLGELPNPAVNPLRHVRDSHGGRRRRLVARHPIDADDERLRNAHVTTRRRRFLPGDFRGLCLP